MNDMDRYLDQACRRISGPTALRRHLREELREHLEEAIHALLAEGLSQEEAAAKAIESLGEPEVISRIAQKAGLDARALLEGAADAVVKAELRATTEEAVARGTFGAPTFFVGDQMFFGNDRLDFVERALVEHGKS